MMLDRENNEHSEDSASMQKSMMLSLEKGENTRSLDLCVPILSMSSGKINGAKANEVEGNV